MSTSTKERTTWVCDNCTGTTSTERKRCRDCGTSRY
jgi:RNA polymerase subunit RPABC4/transcription elongation factor Spt4